MQHRAHLQLLKLILHLLVLKWKTLSTAKKALDLKVIATEIPLFLTDTEINNSRENWRPTRLFYHNSAKQKSKLKKLSRKQPLKDSCKLVLHRTLETNKNITPETNKNITPETNKNITPETNKSIRFSLPLSVYILI